MPNPPATPADPHEDAAHEDAAHEDASAGQTREQWPSLEGTSLEGTSLEGTSLEGTSLEGTSLELDSRGNPHGQEEARGEEAPDQDYPRNSMAGQVALARTHAAARAAIARGWAVIPLRPRDKAPIALDWTHAAIAHDAVDHAFRLVHGGDGRLAAPNLGVRLGAGSGGLVDVDLDTPEAVALAYDLLPSTSLISGHVSKPASHLWYVLSAGATESGLTRLAFSSVATPTQPAAMLVELRGDGHQTMIPPSVHPSGEPVVWARDGEPARVDLATLRAGVAQVAAGAQLARAWPERGLRDEAALALCGMLARGGWEAARMDAFVCAVARAAGDEEWAKRGKGAHTHERLAAGQPVNGTQRLAEVLGGGDVALGQPVVAKVRAWLGLTRREGAQGAQGAQHGRHAPPDTPELHALHALHALDTPDVLDVLASQQVLAGLPFIKDVVDQPVESVFGDRLYLGMLNILDGDPGLGKTLVALDLAARITTGRALPDESPGLPPCGVVYLTAEDDHARVLKPRFRAAGGDLARLLAVTQVNLPTASGPWTPRLPTLRDLDLLALLIAHAQARLVVIDPLVAFLPSGVSANNDQDMRSVLTPLASLAERTRAAFLLIRHLNKSGEGRALYRGGGSIGITGAVRSALLVARDPRDAHTVVLASNKNNLAVTPASLAYRVAAAAGMDPDEGRPPAVVVWQGVVAYTADALLASLEATREHEPSHASAVQRAVTFLSERLAGGRLGVRTIQTEAAAQRPSITAAALDRAKAALRLRVFKQGAAWYWELPEGEQDEQDTQDTQE